jgi:hypothetical protein
MKGRQKETDWFELYALAFCILVAFLSWHSIITGSFESICEDRPLHPSFWDALGCIFMLLWRFATYLIAPLATSVGLLILTARVRSK